MTKEKPTEGNNEYWEAIWSWVEAIRVTSSCLEGKSLASAGMTWIHCHMAVSVLAEWLFLQLHLPGITRASNSMQVRWDNLTLVGGNPSSSIIGFLWDLWGSFPAERSVLISLGVKSITLSGMALLAHSATFNHFSFILKAFLEPGKQEA